MEQFVTFRKRICTKANTFVKQVARNSRKSNGDHYQSQNKDEISSKWLHCLALNDL